MKLRIGSRKSDLAQIQARLVGRALRTLNSTIELEYIFKDVGVDLDLKISLVEAESRGLFTKDLSNDLLRGKLDLVVHSWKDLPTTGNDETCVAATLERDDPRDLVLIKKKTLESKSLSFLSSSPRRELNLGSFLREHVFVDRKLSFVPVRGNLPTRLRSFVDGPHDGLVLALAAAKRLRNHGNAESQAALDTALACSNCIVVPVIENPPAPAQGALAIEIRKDNLPLLALLQSLNHAPTYKDVLAERNRLEDFGGGCHLALGIFQRSVEQGVLRVEKGLTPEGARLSLQEWIPPHALPRVAPNKIFVASALELFDRRSLEIAQPSTPNGQLFLVSKADALPEHWRLQDNDVIWAAGLKTWKKLRERGLWVSGCQEGLGETFFPLPVELWPATMPLKLSHAAAPEKLWPLWATYELVRNDTPLPDLSPYEMFEWPSGSVFRACVEAQPNIRSKLHCCGLGNTYDELIKEIPSERLFALASSPS